MRSVKVFKRDDGSQVQITVNLVSDFNRAKFEYSWFAWSRGKGKKKWISPSNSDDYTWRRLSMEDRSRHNTNLYLQIATIEEVQITAEELWQSLRPNLIQQP
jgi:hypothetical protein